MQVAFITNLCTHYRYKLFSLLSEKYNFDFYFFDDEDKTKEDISHLKIFRDQDKFNYLSTFEILKELIKNRPEIIIKCTNNKWAFLGTFIIAKLIRAKFIVWHSMWYYPHTLQYKLFSWVLIKILKDYADAIIVYGEHGKRFLVKKRVNPDKIFIAWQTVDNEVFGREVKDDEIVSVKEKIQIPNNKKIIIYVGRVIEIKGIEYLLKALNKLEKNSFVFVVIGDGELKNSLENYCNKMGIDHRLAGLIPYHHLPPYYKIASVLVLPSITSKTFKEPWGVVVNEAFNQGCPVVVTDAVGAGLGGLVNDRINGFVVPECSSKSLADAIKLIITDDKLRESFSKNASDEIKKWTYERQAAGFLNAVDHALKA